MLGQPARYSSIRIEIYILNTIFLSCSMLCLGFLLILILVGRCFCKVSYYFPVRFCFYGMYLNFIVFGGVLGKVSYSYSFNPWYTNGFFLLV